MYGGYSIPIIPPPNPNWKNDFIDKLHPPPNTLSAVSFLAPLPEGAKVRHRRMKTVILSAIKIGCGD
jgi:hypothetical protein